MVTAKEVKEFLEKLAGLLHENVEELARLDGQSGDGDLGASMDSAASAMAETAQAEAGADLGMLLMKVAMACNKAAPSTMGTLVSSGIMAVAKAWKGKEQVGDAELAAIPRQFADAMMARGKAQVGDKTILDALVPMAEAVEAVFAENGDLAAAFAAGAEAAQKGAQATCGMLAKTGRARWIGERARENMDGGAALCALVARGIL